MKRKYVFTALFLCLACLMPFIAACSEKGDPVSGTEVTTAAVSGETAAEETMLPESLLAGRNYDGYEYTVYSYDNSNFRGTFIAEAENGDPVNDAVYARNRAAEEKFGIVIKGLLFPADNETTKSNIRKSAAASDHAYSLITGNTYNMTALSAEGLFCNWYSLPEIDFSAPWWIEDAVSELSYRDKAFLVTGSSMYSTYSAVLTFFFNKDLAADYNTGDPYQWVYDDVWTFAKLGEVTKDLWEDLNRDEKRDAGDLYGLAFGNDSPQSMASAFGVRIMEKNADNVPELIFDSEHTADVFDSVRDFLTGQQGVYNSKSWDGQCETFKSGLNLFVHTTFNYAGMHFRETEFEWGIMPMPKFDENQKNYITGAAVTAFLAIMNTTADLERDAYIAEALNYYGLEYITPAYYEVTLQNKLVTDNDAVAMMDILFDTRSYDFGEAYSSFDTYGYAMSKYLDAKEGFASFSEKLGSAGEANYRFYFDAFDAIE